MDMRAVQYHERYRPQELMREAEKERLVHLAKAQRPRRRLPNVRLLIRRWLPARPAYQPAPSPCPPEITPC